MNLFTSIIMYDTNSFKNILFLKLQNPSDERNSENTYLLSTSLRKASIEQLEKHNMEK